MQRRSLSSQPRTNLLPQAALSVDKLAVDAMVARYFQLAHLITYEQVGQPVSSAERFSKRKR